MEHSFSDVINLAMKCKFSDCTHKSEPRCAVRNALENGILTEDRWKSYLKIQRESEFQAEKENRSKTKEIKKSSRKMKKHSSRIN